jgi:hypothetical protein
MSQQKPASNPKAEFERLLNALITLLLNAKGHLTIGRGVDKMLTNEPEISRAAPNFWALTIYAHFDAAQLLAFKLFDTQPRAVSIRHLLVLADQRPEIFTHGTGAQLRAVLQFANNQLAMLPPLEAINAKRNRVIAHLEQTVIHDPEKAAAATRVTGATCGERSVWNFCGVNERHTSVTRPRTRRNTSCPSRPWPTRVFNES